MSSQQSTPSAVQSGPEGPRPPREPTRAGWGGQSSRLLRRFRGTQEGAPAFERYAGVLVLVGLMVVFSSTKPDLFPTYRNFVGIAGNQSISGLVALGLIVPLAAGVFDISINGMMTLSVVAVTGLFQYTNGAFPVWLAVVVVLALACVVGLVNAGLVVGLGVDPFIATIGTGAVLTGVSQVIGNGSTLTFHIPKSFTNFGIASVAKMPSSLLIFAGLALLVWYILAQTPAGRILYATGAGREAARLSGVRTTRVLIVAFMSSAVGAAIAGILYAAQLGQGPPGVGDSFLLPAYATAFLGATIIKPGRFNVAGLVVAILILAVGINGFELLGAPFWVESLFQGLALVGAVALSQIRGVRRAKA
jgi:ribose transport system permease protein